MIQMEPTCTPKASTSCPVRMQRQKTKFMVRAPSLSTRKPPKNGSTMLLRDERGAGAARQAQARQGAGHGKHRGARQGARGARQEPQGGKLKDHAPGAL